MLLSLTERLATLVVNSKVFTGGGTTDMGGEGAGRNTMTPPPPFPHNGMSGDGHFLHLEQKTFVDFLCVFFLNRDHSPVHPGTAERKSSTTLHQPAISSFQKLYQVKALVLLYHQAHRYPIR